MADRLSSPRIWKVVAFIDTSRQIDGAFPYRYGPQGYVEGYYGWSSVMDAEGRPLTFETPEEAEAWIGERKLQLLSAERETAGEV